MGVNTSRARGFTPGTTRRILRRNRGERQEEAASPTTVGSASTETPGSLEPRSKERLLPTSPEEGSQGRWASIPRSAGETPSSRITYSTTETSPAIDASPQTVSPSPYTPAPIVPLARQPQPSTTVPTNRDSPRVSERSQSSTTSSLSPEARARIGDSGDPRTHPSPASAISRATREDTACATGEQTEAASEYSSAQISDRRTSSSASSTKYVATDKKAHPSASPSPDPRRNLTPDFQTPPLFKDTTPSVREASATSTSSRQPSSSASGRGAGAGAGSSSQKSPTSLRSKFSPPYTYSRPRSGASPAFKQPVTRGPLYSTSKNERPTPQSPAQVPISVDKRSRGSALHPVHRNQTHLLSTSQRCADTSCKCHTGCGKPECTVCQRKKVTLPAMQDLSIGTTPTAGRRRAMPRGSPHPARSGSAGGASAGK